MYLVWLVVMVSACGRIGFAVPRSGSDAGGADGAATVYLINSVGGRPIDLGTLDLATGEVTLVGQLPEALGPLGGLAWWDANTLYAASPNATLVEITLSPFGGAVRQTLTTGGIGALERDGTSLLGIDGMAGQLVRIVPGGSETRVPMATSGADGGDVWRTATGDWLWWANLGCIPAPCRGQLVRFDPIDGTILSANPPIDDAPYFAGLVADINEALYGVAAAVSAVVPIDATGKLGVATPLCMPCPTPYTMSTGDATRSR